MMLAVTRMQAEVELFEVHFPTRHGGDLVDCAVDEEAIDVLDGAGEGRSMLDRFAPHRPFFELLAAALYEETGMEPRIGARHVARFRIDGTTVGSRELPASLDDRSLLD